MNNLIKKAFPELFDVETDKTDIENTPLGDMNFLTRLELGELTEQESKELTQLLARSPLCRRTLVEMIKNGFLFSESESDVMSESRDEEDRETTDLSTPQVASAPIERSRRTTVLWTSVVAAAVVAIVATLKFALVEPDTVAMNPRGVKPAPNAPANIDEAKRNLESMLTDSEKTFYAELWRYGYEPSGIDPSKALTSPTQRTQDVCDAFDKYLSERPDDAETRLEYVRYLLYVARDAGRAKTVAESLKNCDELEILMIQGIIAFEEERDFDAREAFEAYLKIEPKNFAARYNLATTLWRLGETDAAKELFQKLSAETLDSTLREQIDLLIEK